MDIECIDGTAPRLYELVAPLVMNPAVLRLNNNYPFKTSRHHVWYIAIENNRVTGFMPFKKSEGGICIDNYYVGNDDTSLIDTMLERIITDVCKEGLITATVHKRHVKIFAGHGFRTYKEWKNYDKMEYIPEKRK